MFKGTFSREPLVKDALLVDVMLFAFPSPLPTLLPLPSLYRPLPSLYRPLLPRVLILSDVRVFLIFHGFQTHEIRGDLLHLYTGGACQAFDVFDNSMLDMVQVLREEKQNKRNSW